MITAIVEYTLPPSIGRQECLEHFTAIAPGFREIPGFRRKHFLYSDAGGDLDAAWEDASGTEAVSGDNPTPDQSNVEENAHAVGVNFEDNEELEFLEKIERRDRQRFELDPRSKTEDDTI